MELCIDFGGTEIKIAVAEGGAVAASAHVPVVGAEADLATAADAARRLCAGEGIEPDAVGIAVPGVVDVATGRMLHAHEKYGFLDGVDLSAWGRSTFGAPTVVENDARAALVGEVASGSVRGARDVVAITLGTGIGTAAMVGGVLVRGRSGHAGILGGHVTADLDGPRCACGNIGCAEELASARALRAFAPLTMRDLFERDDAVELRERFLRVWGTVAVTLVRTYDPEVVVLSGGILRAGRAVSDPLRAYVDDHTWPSMTPPRTVVAAHPELSVARGLSVLAQSAANPLHRLEAP